MPLALSNPELTVGRAALTDAVEVEEHPTHGPLQPMIARSANTGAAVTNRSSSSSRVETG